MTCNSAMLACPWSVGHYCLQQDFKLLRLHSYDIILGMDWLEKYSPMKVYWKHKWLAIPHQGQTVVLHGFQSDSDTKDVVIQLLSVQLHETTLPAPDIPPEVSLLLSEFQDLFAIPTDLPPPRIVTMPFPWSVGHVRSISDPAATHQYSRMRLNVRCLRCLSKS